MYGKQTEAAIAAMSRLAEVYDGGRTRLSASDIADARGLQRPSVAKVLSVLSQAGLVTGSPGPGGGFVLARHPKEIAIFDVFVLFERQDDARTCPFGGGICGSGKNCPLHDDLAAVHEATERLLHEVTFDKFRIAVQENGWRPKVVGSNRRVARAR
jgi:Rrf2 family protein